MIFLIQIYIDTRISFKFLFLLTLIKFEEEDHREESQVDCFSHSRFISQFFYSQSSRPRLTFQEEHLESSYFFIFHRGRGSKNSLQCLKTPLSINQDDFFLQFFLKGAMAIFVCRRNFTEKENSEIAKNILSHIFLKEG